MPGRARSLTLPVCVLPLTHSLTAHSAGTLSGSPPTPTTCAGAAEARMQELLRQVEDLAPLLSEAALEAAARRLDLLAASRAGSLGSLPVVQLAFSAPTAAEAAAVDDEHDAGSVAGAMDELDTPALQIDAGLAPGEASASRSRAAAAALQTALAEELVLETADNKAGYKGVMDESRPGANLVKPYSAKVDRKRIGFFSTCEEAALARARVINAAKPAKRLTKAQAEREALEWASGVEGQGSSFAIEESQIPVAPDAHDCSFEEAIALGAMPRPANAIMETEVVSSDDTERAAGSGLRCGTFGCDLPDKHSGLHRIPSLGRRPRCPKRKWADGSSNCDDAVGSDGVAGHAEVTDTSRDDPTCGRGNRLAPSQQMVRRGAPRSHGDAVTRLAAVLPSARPALPPARTDFMTEAEAKELATAEGLTLAYHSTTGTKGPCTTLYRSVYYSKSSRAPYLARLPGRSKFGLSRELGAYLSPHEAALALARTLGAQGSAELASAPPRDRYGWEAKEAGMTAAEARSLAHEEGLTLQAKLSGGGFLGVFRSPQNTSTARKFFAELEVGDCRRSRIRVNFGSFASAEEGALARARFLRKHPMEELRAQLAMLQRSGRTASLPPAPSTEGSVRIFHRNPVCVGTCRAAGCTLHDGHLGAHEVPLTIDNHCELVDRPITVMAYLVDDDEVMGDAEEVEAVVVEAATLVG